MLCESKFCNRQTQLGVSLVSPKKPDADRGKKSLVCKIRGHGPSGKKYQKARCRLG